MLGVVCVSRRDVFSVADGFGFASKCLADAKEIVDEEPNTSWTASARHRVCYQILMAPRKPKKDIGDILDAVAKAAAQNPILAQNIKYFKAAQAGPTQLAKTAAIDLAAGAAGAGASRVLASGVSRVSAKLGKSVGDYTSDKSFDILSAGLNKMKGGGRVFRTNTPMGPSLGSTRIMTPNQRDAAITGLKRAASNRSDEIGAAIEADLREVSRAAVRNILAAAPAAVVVVPKKKARGGGKNKK